MRACTSESRPATDHARWLSVLVVSRPVQEHNCSGNAFSRESYCSLWFVFAICTIHLTFTVFFVANLVPQGYLAPRSLRAQDALRLHFISRQRRSPFWVRSRQAAGSNLTCGLFARQLEETVGPSVGVHESVGGQNTPSRLVRVLYSGANRCEEAPARKPPKVVSGNHVTRAQSEV